MTRGSDVMLRDPFLPRLGGGLFGRMFPEFDRLFSEFMRPGLWTEGAGEWLPPAEIAETEKEFRVLVELPGIDMKGLDISFANGVLTISGEKVSTTGENENLYCSETYSGSFRRSFSIPGSIDEDHLEATYNNGILKVVLTKTKETQARKIEVHQ